MYDWVMKRLTTILVVVLFVAGCTAVSQESVKPHSILGTKCMIVPEGTRIGEYEAPEDGVFIGASVFESMEIKIRVETEKGEGESSW